MQGGRVAALDGVGRGVVPVRGLPAERGEFGRRALEGEAARLDEGDVGRVEGNVERIASEKIGRETVQYVSNIYKYYVAYRLLLERKQAREGAKQGGAGL